MSPPPPVRGGRVSPEASRQQNKSGIQSALPHPIGPFFFFFSLFPSVDASLASQERRQAKPGAQWPDTRIHQGPGQTRGLYPHTSLSQSDGSLPLTRITVDKHYLFNKDAKNFQSLTRGGEEFGKMGKGWWWWW